MHFSTGWADAVVLAALRAETQWPPTYPRRGTLLIPSNDPTTPRETWSVDEWKSYALFLEDAGGMMARRTRRVQDELRSARAKSSRRKRALRAMPTLLSSDVAVKKKAGRKPAYLTIAAAEGALAIRAEMENIGLKMTDRAALAEYFKRQGQGGYRAMGTAARNLLNAMVKSRKRHDFSIAEVSEFP